MIYSPPIKKHICVKSLHCKYNNDHCFAGIEGAKINVEDRSHPVRSAKDGDFWRLLLPGSYEVNVTKEGYSTVKRTIQVTPGPATRQEFTLTRKGQSRDETSSELQEVKTDDDKKPVPVSLVIGLTVVCVVSLMLALALAIMLAKKYRSSGSAQGEYSQVHTDP